MFDHFISVARTTWRRNCVFPLGKFLTLPLKPHIYHLRSRTVLKTPLMSEQDVKFDPWFSNFSNLRSLIWLTLTSRRVHEFWPHFLHIKDQKLSKWTLAKLNELWMSNQKCRTWTSFSCKPIRFSCTGLIWILLRWNNVDPTNAISQIQPKNPKLRLTVHVNPLD